MITIGIETSCDETSVSLLEDGNKILSNLVSSQVEIHKTFGGVVPEVASRIHVEVLNRLIELALEKAKKEFKDIDLIAVTQGPGLIGALWIGIMAAKTLSLALNKPLIGVNHLEGHIFANFLGEDPPTFPFIALIVSGGHTEYILVEDIGVYKILGQTLDDAAGEAFDKVARILGLNYPGGPEIDKISKMGKPIFNFPKIKCDRELDISFSGIKTAVLYLVRDLKKEGKEIPVADIAASFQERVVEELLERAFLALNKFNIKTLVVSGGVASNSYLQRRFKEESRKEGIKLYIPPPYLCTDNGAMIACAGYHLYQKGYKSDLYLSANPDLLLGER
ncbi:MULTISPECIES: tRNA (adenosine(37)-N6)-threonylcarbamoyltransferase complex transferase subunit TsaD [Dictyoglomus]|jgi:N6-L-threonylcarbamoyladenine synthase|uniref:tRNA (adenosine(37)-N6)-threonylcarbamoyltransferase complex transferase subunit TsaD n=1 Tax=Dictyoglomus TaxID=13 RepID=UPI000CCE55A9|nr:tRNA (adenosine(37)-N6)-threonylcarbamoyltransferase complex transferase subunit TsaD [Dictyoglomus turgidum]PNV80557.1 MAG: tRNA (adenosine(37)-N6)-threonylcarbamoyltransferase complex transferase subunit TsaD [Dictyoglomus turgidum]